MMKKTMSAESSLRPFCILLICMFSLLCETASGAIVGERHLVAHEASAALRDSEHSDQLRITVWYPAIEGSKESPLDLGPEFFPSSAAADAPFADMRQHPVILFSHGYGGTARMMAWFCTALARAGYIVIAVDHPGNNGRDPMTMAGGVFFWERPGDLEVALQQVERTLSIAPHLDLSKIGVAGFSAGGFAAIAAAGGRVDLSRFIAFCKATPSDGECKPAREFPVTLEQGLEYAYKQDNAAALERSKESLVVPGVKAAFVIAPGMVQSFDPNSLQRISMPVSIVVGDADPVAPPATNGKYAASLIPRVQIKVIHKVGHFDFLSDCTQAGKDVLPICQTQVPQESTHKMAIDRALAFFADCFGSP